MLEKRASIDEASGFQGQQVVNVTFKNGFLDSTLKI